MDPRTPTAATLNTTENISGPALESLRTEGLLSQLPTSALGSTPQRWSGLAPHRLKRVLSCIEMRLAEPIQVGELAQEVHMSPFHFTRMFKLATGHSPHKYITLQRIERAKRLLATSDMPIAAIAAAVGYQTQAHFTGVFARHAGTTPKVFRVSNRDAGVLPLPAQAPTAVTATA